MDNDLAQLVNTVLSQLREVESKVVNINQAQQRGEFYANRLLCAVGHLTHVIIHMEHSSRNARAEKL